MIKMDKKKGEYIAPKTSTRGYFRQPGDFEKLCWQINYQFRNRALLAQAITTKTALQTGLQKSVIGHQEEMAFFGDSILRMVIDNILMEEFPYYERGKLSQLRDLLVQNANLIDAARKFELSHFIIMDANQTRQCETGKPKLLADTVEAIICAIYRDSNQNLAEVKSFILMHSDIADGLRKHRESEQQKYHLVIRAIQTVKPEVLKAVLEQVHTVNFLFSHIENEYDDDPRDPGVIEHEQFSTPLELAIKFLEDLACAGKNCEAMLTIIEMLLKAGADPNLHAKGRQPVIYSLFSAMTRDGNKTDPFFLGFMRSASESLSSSQLTKDMEKELANTAVPGWDKITDRLVTLLCQHGAKLDDESQQNMFSLLGLAVIHLQPYKFDCLLASGVDPDSTNHGQTALHVAAESRDGHVYVTKLLAAQADANIVDRSGKKPFDVASTVSIKNDLLIAEIKRAPIIRSDTINYVELSKRALIFYSEGVQQKSPDKLARATQLYSLVLKYELSKRKVENQELVTSYFNLGMTYMQRELYEKAKPYLERAYILSLMHLKLRPDDTSKYAQRFRECDRKLKELAAQKKQDARTNDTIVKQPELIGVDKELFAAIRTYHPERVQSLLMEGANSECKNEEGEPVLHFAIHTYSAVSAMASVNRDLDPYRVSIGAFPRALTQIIDLLLTFAADPNGRDGKGRTALHVAAIIDKSEIVSTILRNGGDPTIRDFSNQFAANYAKTTYTRKLILAATYNASVGAVDQVDAHLSSAVRVNTQPGMMRVGDILAAYQLAAPTQPIPPTKPAPATDAAAPAATMPAAASVPTTRPAPMPLFKPAASKAAAAKTTKNKYKTDKCRFFKEGNPDSCSRGDKCKFAHGITEMRK